MSMQIELMLVQPVDNLGDPGDLVRVRKGYARNFLLPRGLATVPSEDAMKQVEAVKKRIAAERAEREAHARVIEEKLATTSIHVEAKAGEEGHLYGSVNAARIAEALVAEGFDLPATHILLEEPIKELGIYDVEVKVMGDVRASVKLYVVEPPPEEAS